MQDSTESIHYSLPGEHTLFKTTRKY